MLVYLIELFVKSILVDNGIDKKDANDHYKEIIEALRARGAGL